MTTPPLWFGPLPARPELDGDVDADLCVVGLGGSGLAAIDAGLEAGMRVVGLEAADVAAGAAGRNGGFLLAGPAWFHHDARRRVGRDIAGVLYQCTVEELERMAGHPTVRQVGSVRVAHDDAEREDIEQHYAALIDDGFEAARYRGVEGEGLRIASDAVFSPHAYCAWHAAQCEARGARLFVHSPVREVSSGRVTTDRGCVRASMILLATDGGLRALAPTLADRVSIWRLQMLATEPVGRRLTEQAVYARYGYDYWQQLPDGRLAVGGGRDVGGEGERDATSGVSPEVQAHLEALVRERLGVDAAIRHRWSGVVAYTDDGLPLCERLRPGVVAIGAYCGTGNIIGRRMAREVIARWNGDASPFLAALAEARAHSEAAPQRR